MADWGMEATNELGSAFLNVGDTPAGFPARVYGTFAGQNAGLPCTPRHALISVEGGDIRYRLDGSDVVEPYGIRANDGTVIDWTDPLRDFSSFIERFSAVATRYNDGESSVLLNISWRT